jgi:hypothetical protein
MIQKDGDTYRHLLGGRTIERDAVLELALRPGSVVDEDRQPIEGAFLVGRFHAEEDIVPSLLVEVGDEPFIVPAPAMLYLPRVARLRWPR